MDKRRPPGARPPFPKKEGQPGRTPAPRAIPIQPQSLLSTQARLVALDTLLDVHMQDAYAALALGDRLRRNARMDERDRRLVTELVYGTIENQLHIDFLLDQLLERKNVEIVIRDILRMGAYQMLFLDRIPINAAVDESVTLTRLKFRESYTGFVNAVLRSLDRKQKELVYPDEEEDFVAALSVRNSMPPWIVETLVASYGAQEAKEIVSYRRKRQGGVTVRPNLEQTSADAFETLLKRVGASFAPGKTPGSYIVQQAGDVTRLAEYQRGWYSIQGESAMLAAQVMGVRPGMNILDVCAAPGGKTALMAEAMRGSGRVYAWDIHAHRVLLIRAMAERLQLENVRAIERDATVPKEDLFSSMDGVLLDVPCSGLGMMWEKPDIRYRQTPEKVADLVQLQKQLLDVCCQYVKPGGTLVYATCSILPEENQQQIDAFLQAHPEFTARGLAEQIPEALRPEYSKEHYKSFRTTRKWKGFTSAEWKKRVPNERHEKYAARRGKQLLARMG